MAFLLDIDGLPLLTAGAALLACYCSLDRCLPKAGKQEISAAFKAGLMREMQAMSKTQGAEDPVLKRGEFMAMFTRHGVPEAIANGLFEMVDADNDQEASLSELIVVLSKYYTSRHERARMMFQLFDANGDGALDFAEVKMMMKAKFGEGHSEDQIEDLASSLFKHIDVDRSGTISFEGATHSRHRLSASGCSASDCAVLQNLTNRTRSIR